jgi:HB1, ASXL, restriction endonuclease HTH domain
MTYWQATEKVLTNVNQPITAREILQRAVSRGLIATKGKTPLASLQAVLYVRSKRVRGLSASLIRGRLEPSAEPFGGDSDDSLVSSELALT